MIASIQGKVLLLGEDNLVVDVGGIGYLVYVPKILPATLRRGEKVSLLTHLVVREDSLTLFGFQDQEEVFLFQQLIKVNGVGPRLALETISTHTPDVIKRAVLNKQEEIFSQVSGIPETAGINAEVREALTTLGYSVLEAQAALQNIPDDAPLDLEIRLTIALRHFS